MKFLLNRMKVLKIKASTLYLERGFASVKVIKYLTRTGMKAVIACPIRGTTGGVKALCVGPHSYVTTHRFSRAKHGTALAQVALARGGTPARRTKRRAKKMQWPVFIHRFAPSAKGLLSPAGELRHLFSLSTLTASH